MYLNTVTDKFPFELYLIFLYKHKVFIKLYLDFTTSLKERKILVSRQIYTHLFLNWNMFFTSPKMGTQDPPLENRKLLSTINPTQTNGFSDITNLSDCYTKTHPNRCGLLDCYTKFHPDNPIGELEVSLTSDSSRTLR